MRHRTIIDWTATEEQRRRRDRPPARSWAKGMAEDLRHRLDAMPQPRISLAREDVEILARWLEEADTRRAAYEMESRLRIAAFIKAHIPERTSGKKNYMPDCCRAFGAILIGKLEGRPR